jgi:hypothetical protein
MNVKKLILIPFIFLCFKVSYSQSLKAHHNVYSPKVSASEAINIVKKELVNFRTGEVSVSKSKSSIKSIDVYIKNSEKSITKIRLNPQTGDILPKGYRTYYPEVLISEEDALKKVEKVLPVVKIGNPWLGVDKNWRVPLILDGSVIAEVIVNGDNGQISSK